MRNAIYAGSFDPFTKGHEDVLLKALGLFDEITILVCYNSTKQKGLLSPSMRAMSINKYLETNSLSAQVGVLLLDENGVAVDFAKKVEAKYLIRGIRTVSDFEYEMSVAAMNQVLNEEVNTVFFTPNAENQFTSSSMVREFLRLKKYEKAKALLPDSILEFILLH